MTLLHDALQVPADYVAAFNARDEAALARVYTSDALLVPVPGQAVTGAALSAANRHLMGLASSITATVRRAYVAGDVGLLVVDWVAGKAAGTATDVVCRQGDGSWRYVIDNPHGII
jgi:ketosteroid isomerase-like protein